MPYRLGEGGSERVATREEKSGPVDEKPSGEYLHGGDKMAEEGGAEGIVELDGRGGCSCGGCGSGHVLPARRAEERGEKKAERERRGEGE